MFALYIEPLAQIITQDTSITGIEIKKQHVEGTVHAGDQYVGNILLDALERTTKLPLRTGLKTDEPHYKQWLNITY